MGYWENTAYIRSGDLDRIAQTIINVLAKEGVHLIERPSEREYPSFSRMQYGTAEESLYWAVALIPARTGWTAVKTAPFELLLERPKSADKARLSEIAMALGVDCFQLNIYDGAEWTTFECTPGGRICASEAAEQNSFLEFDDNYSATHYHKEPLRYVRPLAIIHADPGMPNDLSNLSSEGSFGENMQVAGNGHDNLIQVEYLIPFRPLLIPGSRTLYFQNNEGKRME